jgi:nucleoside-diphosphate-sugar epimerase
LTAAYSLVTGASGFIGRHLVDALLETGQRVLALCRPNSEVPQHWRDKVERIDCDDWSLDAISAIVGERRFECLFHLAAYGVVPTDRDASMMFRVNADLPEDLVRLCARQSAVMVMAGSSAEYGRLEGRLRLTEDHPLEDQKSYGASKALGSMRAVARAHELGVPLRVLRLFNVYGPGEAPHRLLPSLVRGLTLGQRIALSEGSQIRDFVYVGDVVEALLVAADHARARAGMPPKVWNVATEQGHSVREFAEVTAQLFGGGRRLLGFGDVPMRPDEIDWLVGSARRIREESGWVPRHDLSSGIAVSLARMTEPTTQTRAVQ